MKYKIWKEGTVWWHKEELSKMQRIIEVSIGVAFAIGLCFGLSPISTLTNLQNTITTILIPVFGFLIGFGLARLIVEWKAKSEDKK